MELVHFVKNEEAELAKKMEDKLASLDRRAGVLFVGVAVQPSTLESPTIYQVWVGCSRDVDPRLIPTLVEVALYEEVKAGHVIKTETRMGRTCG